MMYKKLFTQWSGRWYHTHTHTLNHSNHPDQYNHWRSWNTIQYSQIQKMVWIIYHLQEGKRISADPWQPSQSLSMTESSLKLGAILNFSMYAEIPYCLLVEAIQVFILNGTIHAMRGRIICVGVRVYWWALDPEICIPDPSCCPND